MFIQSFVLPAGSQVAGLQIQKSQKTEFSGNYFIQPTQLPCITSNAPCDSIPPNPVIYNSNNPFPTKNAHITGDRYIGTYHIVSISICPFEYIPANRKLFLYQQIDFTLQYTIGTDTFAGKVSAKMDEITRKMLSDIVTNSNELHTYNRVLNQNNQSLILNTGKKMVLHWQPDDIGDAPEYIIITNNTLKPYFQILADYKTKRGFSTVIATVEDIYQNYPGVDHPEQIRNYLKDVYNHWGMKNILMGGDSNIVPARFWRDSDYYNNTLKITDRYYSDLGNRDATYNWNANGNSLFGERNDDIRHNINNYIGRFPVTTSQQVLNLIHKVQNYEKLANVSDRNYINNLLFVGAYHQYTNSTNNWPLGIEKENKIYDILSYVNKNKWMLLDDYNLFKDSLPNVSQDRLGDTLSLTTFTNALNNGNQNGHFHFITHTDHGNPYAIGTSSKKNSEIFTTADADRLHNGNYYQIMYTGACEPGEFDKDCFAEHYINNPQGGGVAILANSGFGHYSDDRQASALYRSLYLCGNNMMGIAATQAITSVLYGYDIRLNFFGDPTMMVWTDPPERFDLNVPQDVTINNTTNNAYTVQLASLNQDALISIYKYNYVTHQIEIYGSQTVPAGQTSATFYLHPDTEGQLLVTATAKNYLPATATTQIHMPQAHVYVTDIRIYDANRNNVIEPGELINLKITLNNSGHADFGYTNTHLHADDLLVNQIIVTQADVHANSIEAGESVILSNYQFQVNANGTLPHYLKFWLDINDSNGDLHHSDEFYLDLEQTGLALGMRYVTDANGNIINTANLQANTEYHLHIALNNIGDIEATGINAGISSSVSLVNLSQDQSAYPNIEAHERQTNTTDYVFTLTQAPSGAMPFSLQATNSLGVQQTFTFDLLDASPNIISGYHFTSTNNSITLLWKPLRIGNNLVDINGYNIYRSTSLNGTYEKINERIISGSSLYTDNAIDPLTSTYYYKISVVSTTNLEIPLHILLTNPADYNNGVAVQGYKAWITLPTHQGYPITHLLNTYMKSSPTVFDVNGDGFKEVFTQAFNYEDASWYYNVDDRRYNDGGRIFAYDHQGHELFNIDGNTTNWEGFALTFHRIPSKTAIFDLDQDGHADVFAVDEATDIHAFKTIDTHNDSFNRPDYFWDYPVYDNQIIHYSNFSNNPPIIADVNNDGYAEIITLDKEQRLHIFNKDKQEIYNFQISTTQDNKVRLNIAVGDIDNDGYKNIVFMIPKNDNTNQTELYSCQFNGSNFETNLIKTLSSYTDYEIDWRYHWETYYTIPVVLGDINNDNTMDIICYVKTGATSYKLFALDQSGNAVSSWPVNGIVLSNPKGLSIGQINNDDYLEVVVTDGNHIKVFNYNGQLIHNINTPGTLRGVPILADVDTDNDIEIIVNENNYLNAYDLNGTVLPSWGMASLSERFEGSPVISPLDDDKNCVMINDNYSTIYAWDTDGDANKVEWGSCRYNAQNTACYSKLSDLDLTVKDGTDDTGQEPNNITQHLWESTDIWVRNHADGGTQHENPEYDHPVYVYVRVTNRSNVSSTGDEHLKLYWGKARSDLYWPNPWTGQYYDNGVQMGNQIGDITIPILQPGESRVIEFEWQIPNPNNFAGIDPNVWHYCLLSRIEATHDPMTFPETTDLASNVKNNNNIAWKNITVVNVIPNNSQAALTGTVAVGNMTDTNQMYYLELVKDPNEAGNPIFEEAEVKIKMSDALYNAWKQGGEIAEKIEATDDEKKKLVKGDVVLDNIAFAPHEMGTITLTFNFLTEKMTDKDKFTYRLIQHDYYTGKVIGGETFIIQKQPRPLFIADADDEEVDKGDLVTLSAESINEAAEYNWYDMDGNLVYQGKDMTVSAEMAEKFKLEVIATADGFKDYKEVELKLKPSHIEQLTPNPANGQVQVTYKINEGNDAYLMFINISGNNDAVGNYVLNIEESQIDINLASYPTGVYSVVLVTDGQITDMKELIIE